MSEIGFAIFGFTILVIFVLGVIKTFEKSLILSLVLIIFFSPIYIIWAMIEGFLELFFEEKEK